jgi:hypothetical protein
MLFKSKTPEKDKNAAANAAEVMRAVQPQRSVVEHAAARPPITKAGTASCIGGTKRTCPSRRLMSAYWVNVFWAAGGSNPIR